MIKYYTYYSFAGGYKRFYLGSSSDLSEATYYMPYLSMMIEDAKDDKDMAERVELLLKLPTFSIVTESMSLSKIVQQGVYHSGYQLLYRKGEGKELVLLIGQLGEERDEYDRGIPFKLMLVGETEDDAMELDCLVEYICQNYVSFRRELAEWLYHDGFSNGLKFEQKKMNYLIKSLCASDSLKLKGRREKPVYLLIHSENETLTSACKLQGFKIEDVAEHYNAEEMLNYESVTNLSLLPTFSNNNLPNDEIKDVCARKESQEQKEVYNSSKKNLEQSNTDKLEESMDSQVNPNLIETGKDEREDIIEHVEVKSFSESPKKCHEKSCGIWGWFHKLLQSVFSSFVKPFKFR